jgi:hypothetical protein
VEVYEGEDEEGRADMKCKEIVVEYIKKNGFDGLFCSDVSCGCGLDDLAPCSCDMSGCEPAYAFKSKCKGCEAVACEGRDEDDDRERTCYSPIKK